MSFKIVQTKEENGCTLSVVPSGWVVKNILYWPTTPNISKLVKTKGSIPKHSECTKYSCQVKRDNIDTYVKATHIMNQMAAESDSDAPSSLQCQAKFLQKRKAKVAAIDQINFATTVSDFNSLGANYDSSSEVVR